MTSRLSFKLLVGKRVESLTTDERFSSEPVFELSGGEGFDEVDGNFDVLATDNSRCLEDDNIVSVEMTEADSFIRRVWTYLSRSGLEYVDTKHCWRPIYSND